MRLAESTKLLILGNKELLKHCRKYNIDMSKLKQCSIEQMGNNFDTYFLFGLPKENIPKSQCELPLDIDIASQPDVVLEVTVTNLGTIIIENTNKTVRILHHIPLGVDREEEHSKIVRPKIDFVKNKVMTEYGLSKEDAEFKISCSDTFDMVVEFDYTLYLASAEDLWVIFKSEFEKNWEDWLRKIRECSDY